MSQRRLIMRVKHDGTDVQFFLSYVILYGVIIFQQMLLMVVGVSGANGVNVQKKPTATEERRKGKENVTILNRKGEERNALERILIR